MSGGTTLQRTIHGLGLSASGPETVLSALADRLGDFPTPEGDPCDLRFDFDLADSSADHAIEQPVGDARCFYQSKIGAALYFASRDRCYLDCGDDVRVWCDVGGGRCRISILRPEAERLWFATHPLFTLPLMEMLKRRGRFAIHAAGLCRNGRSLLLPGSSGSGKSTLTVALLRAGFDLLGDDLVFLEVDGAATALAFPEKIDVTASTLAFFPELTAISRTKKPPGFPKYQLRAADFFPSHIAWRSAPAAIVFPSIANRSESALAPLSGEEAFLELSASVLLTDTASTKAHLQALGELVRTLPAYRLSTGTDFGQTARLLGDLLA